MEEEAPRIVARGALPRCGPSLSPPLSPSSLPIPVPLPARAPNETFSSLDAAPRRASAPAPGRGGLSPSPSLDTGEEGKPRGKDPAKLGSPRGTNARSTRGSLGKRRLPFPEKKKWSDVQCRGYEYPPRPSGAKPVEAFGNAAVRRRKADAYVSQEAGEGAAAAEAEAEAADASRESSNSPLSPPPPGRGANCGASAAIAFFMWRPTLHSSRAVG